MFSVFGGSFLLKISEGFVPAFLRFVVLPHYPDSRDFVTMVMDLVQRFIATLFNAVKFFVMPSQVKKYYGRKFDPRIGSNSNRASLFLSLTVVVLFLVLITYFDIPSEWKVFVDLVPRLSHLEQEFMLISATIVIIHASNFYRKSSIDVYLMSNRRYSELVLIHFLALVTASSFFYFGFAYLGVFTVVSIYYILTYFISMLLLKERIGGI
ncbi:hypothetical protein [Vibrio marisflavi]|nr:hypothetical protein [Vibrio marisflavi]